jgi:hypothetical protein
MGLHYQVLVGIIPLDLVSKAQSPDMTFPILLVNGKQYFLHKTNLPLGKDDAALLSDIKGYFVDELNNLISQGVTYEGEHYTIDLYLGGDLASLWSLNDESRW